MESKRTESSILWDKTQDIKSDLIKEKTEK